MVEVKHTLNFKDRTTKNILNELKEMKEKGFLYVGHNNDERFQDGYRVYYNQFIPHDEVIQQLETSNKAIFDNCSFYLVNHFIEQLEKRVAGNELEEITIKAPRQHLKEIMEHLRKYDELEVL